MKTLILLLIFLHAAFVNAQTKYNYNNPDLDIPEWLTNPNYIAANESVEKEVNIEADKLAVFSNISVVKLFLSESENNHSTISFYLGTFNKSNKIIDIIHVADLSSSDWNWQNELSFEEIEPGIIKYYCVDLAYGPAENENEKAAGGMVLSRADTVTAYYGVSKEGSIKFSKDLNDLKYAMKHPGSKVVSGTSLEGTDNETIILQIRKQYMDINQNLTSYQKKVKKSGENISLTYYSDGDRIKFIKEVNNSNGQSLDYFFDNQIPIFIYAKNSKNNSESRYYFQNNRMIRWLKGSTKEPIEPGSPEFNKKGNELIIRCKLLTGN